MHLQINTRTHLSYTHSSLLHTLHHTHPCCSIIELTFCILVKFCLFFVVVEVGGIVGGALSCSRMVVCLSTAGTITITKHTSINEMKEWEKKDIKIYNIYRMDGWNGGRKGKENSRY